MSDDKIYECIIATKSDGVNYYDPVQRIIIDNGDGLFEIDPSQIESINVRYQPNDE